MKFYFTEETGNLGEIIGSITSLMRAEIMMAELSAAYARGSDAAPRRAVSIFQRAFPRSLENFPPPTVRDVALD